VIPNPDPWSGMQGLITLQNPDGKFAGALWPQEAVDLPSAIQAYTLNPARAMGLEAITGSIAEAKSADFIVLDRNLFEIAATTIAETKVLVTYFEGTAVFQCDDLYTPTRESKDCQWQDSAFAARSEVSEIRRTNSSRAKRKIGLAMKHCGEARKVGVTPRRAHQGYADRESGLGERIGHCDSREIQ
jgi:Amidohydrolase family